MINYKFSLNKYLDETDKKIKVSPLLLIDNAEIYGHFFVDEIVNLSRNKDYLDEIVRSLQALVQHDISFYEGFGFEIYLIECDTSEAKVLNLFEDNKVEATIPTLELFDLMRNWKQFLESHQFHFE